MTVQSQTREKIEHTQKIRNHSHKAANSLNIGSQWQDVRATSPPGVSVEEIKFDLVENTKMTFSEKVDRDGSVSKGFVVSHDNGSTKGLWRADADTTAEPAQGHADWTLVFEVTA